MIQIKTPDLTLVQKLAGAIMVLMTATWPLLEAFDVGLTNAQTVAIGGFVTAFVSMAVLADAVIRNGRSRIAAAKAMPKPPPARRS